MNLYIESSAVLAWLFEQGSYQKIIKIFNQSENLLSSVLTAMECQRVIARATELKEATRQKLHGVLENFMARWTLMQITEEIQNRVSHAFPIEPVRTLDAIHLASALEFNKIFPTIKVLSLDQRIRNNLEALGLESPL